MRTLALLALIFLTGVPAHAETTYTYLGPLFTSGPRAGDGFISGYFTVLNPLAFQPGTALPAVTGILDWRFGDGVATITPATGTLSMSVAVSPPGSPTGYTGSFSVFSNWLFFARTDDCCARILSDLDVTMQDFGTGGRVEYSSTVPRDRDPMWSVSTVSVPERAILPRLPKLLPRLFGWGVEAKITHGLQRATTWLAAAILRAPYDGTKIYLPSVIVEVIEDCSGRQTLGLMLLVAGLVAAVMPRRRWPWALGLFIAAAVLALEANALRVAGIALGLEHLGAMSRTAKDWIQVGTTGLALGQLVGIGRLIARGRAVPQPLTV